MDIALITSNDRMAQTLQEAFRVVDIDLSLYVSFDDYNKGKSVEVCLIDISVENIAKKSEKTTYFAIIDEKNTDLEGKNNIFYEIYTKPLRIGVVIRDIQLYLIKKQQLSALKPIKMGKFTLNPRDSALNEKKTGNNYKLTEKEQDILLYLYANKSKDVTKQNLLDEVWGYAENVETHTLETHIYRLRQKIEPDPTNPEFLVTFGEGYRLDF